MSKTIVSFKFLLVLGILTLMQGAFALLWAQNSMEVIEAEGKVEWVQVVPELGRLEGEKKITVRALRGFGLLPEPFTSLAMELRKQGVDLLSAGPNEIKALVDQAQSGALQTDPKPLTDLLSLFENRDYHQWTVLQPGAVVTIGEYDLFRGSGQVTLKDNTGQTRTIVPQETIITFQALDEFDALAKSGQHDLAKEIQENGPITALSTSTEVDQATTIQAQKEDNGYDQSTTELPRIWGQSPGINLFDFNIYDQSGYMDWTKLGAVCPAPQDGQLVAGSVQTPWGLWAWIIRYDDQGFPLWSRMLGGNYDLSVTSAVPLGKNNFLIAGSMKDQHPAFLLALDDQGQVLWSRTSGPVQPDGAKDWIFALASSEQTALAAGWVKNDSQKALVMSVPADGSPGWRLEMEEGAEIGTAVADGQDWIVAGQGADFTPWVAKINAQGSLLWHKSYGQEYGQITAMTRTDQGKILVAGKGKEKGFMWLKSLEASGEVNQEIQTDLKVNQVPVVESVQGMAVDKNGDIWLAGESVSADGWLAKIAPDGQTHWVHVYGRENGDALKAVLPTTNGAVAVGRSITPDSMDVCALWILTVDESGQPIQAAPMTEQGQILADKVASLMALTSEIPGPHSNIYLQQGKDETLRLALPFTVLTEGLPGFGEQFTSVGQVSAYAKPVPNTPGLWKITLEVPAQMAVHGYTGREIGALVTDQNSLSFDYNAELNTFLEFGALVQNLRYVQIETKTLAGIQQALGDAETEEEIRPGSLQRLAANMKLEQNDQGYWGGPLTVDIEGWKQVTVQGDTLGEIGSIQIKGSYENIDLATLNNIPGELEKFTAEDAPDPEALQNSINTWIQGLGTGQGELILNDLALNIGGPEDQVRLKNLTLKGASVASKQDLLLRDISTEYSVTDLELALDGGQVAVQKASFDLRLDRFSLQKIMLAALDTFLGQGGDSNWENLVNKALGGLELGFGLKGLKVAIPDQEHEIGEGSLRLALTELDEPRANLSLNYLHNEFWSLPMIRPELMPKTVKIDTTLKNIPVAKLTTDWLLLLMNPQSIFTLMSEHNSTLNINALGVDLPIGGLRVNGQGLAKIVTPDAPPIGELEVTIVVKNFQDMVELLASTMDETKAKDIKAMATIVQLAGIEDKEYQDGVLHHYEVKFNSMGQLMVNGQDLSALLFGAGGGNPGGQDSGQKTDED